MHDARQDRRVARTGRLLKEALISLILEKGYEAVSVRDITARANVGRSTFYAHFPSKERLLLAGLDDLHALMAAERGDPADGAARSGFAFSLPLLRHMHGHRRLYHAMVGRQGGTIVQLKMRRMLTAIVRQELKARAAAGARDAAFSEATAQYMVGAFFGRVTWWLDHAAGLSPEEIDGLFNRLAFDGIRA